jgi:hypothetical protein
MLYTRLSRLPSVSISNVYVSIIYMFCCFNPNFDVIWHTQSVAAPKIIMRRQILNWLSLRFVEKPLLIRCYKNYLLRVACASCWRKWRHPEMGIYGELNKQCRTANKEWFFGRGLGGNLINPNRNNWHVRKFWHGTRAWTDPLGRP